MSSLLRQSAIERQDDAAQELDEPKGGIAAPWRAFSLEFFMTMSIEIERPRAAPAVCVLGMYLVACASADAAPPPSTPDRAAQRSKAEVLDAFAPCEKDEIRKQLLERPPPDPRFAAPAPEPGVFLEMAVFQIPAKARSARLPGSVDDLVRDENVRLLGTPHVFVQNEDSSHVPFEERIGLVENVALREISATARAPHEEHSVVDLEIVLQVPSVPSSPLASPPRDSRVRITMAPRDEQTVSTSAPIPFLADRWLLVVATPHVVHDETDLRAIFECKLRRGRRAAEGPYRAP